MAGWQPFNEKHPFGKGATVVSSDNIAHAQMRRMARKAMEQGSATPEQIELVHSSEMLIKKAVEED
jgi:methionine-rich copper-binding protein CopC